MPENVMIAIDDNPGGVPPGTFNPAKPTVQVGDLVFWRNNTGSPHWPAPQNGAKDDWMAAEIPGKLHGQPAPTSVSVSFADAGDYPYVCALHPQETGTITVTS